MRFKSLLIGTMALFLAGAVPLTVYGWGAAEPDQWDSYLDRDQTTFRGHELLVHDALLILKGKRLIPASLAETYLQPIYSTPDMYPTAQTSWGYKRLIEGVRIPDWDLSWDGLIKYISSLDHYYDPDCPSYSPGSPNGWPSGWNAKTGFMYYINGGSFEGEVEKGAIQRFNEGDIEGGFLALGYAIHFLEDGSQPFHMSQMEYLTTIHEPIDGRGDSILFNERLDFEKLALETVLPHNLLSFTDTEITERDASFGHYNFSMNLDSFYHMQAVFAKAQLYNIRDWYNSGNWTSIDIALRSLLRGCEQRIALLIHYVFSEAGMYPGGIVHHPNTAYYKEMVPTQRRSQSAIFNLGPAGFGTIALHRFWPDDITIQGSAGTDKRLTLILVNPAGRVVREDTGPFGGDAVINHNVRWNVASDKGWYTVYATSPDITSGTVNVGVNVWHNQAKTAAPPKLNEPPPPEAEIFGEGGGGHGEPNGRADAEKILGESPSVELGYDVGRTWDSSGDAYRYAINLYGHDTDLFWSDWSFDYGSTWRGGYDDAVLVASLLHFSNFYDDHSIYWKCYRPDGVLYGQTGTYYVYGMNTSGFTSNWWDVFSGWYLKWEGEDYWMQSYQGVWRIEVYVDGSLHTTQYFGVNDPPEITNITSGNYINGGPLEIGTNLKGLPSHADIRLDDRNESARISMDYAPPYSGVVNASSLADGAHTAYAYVSSGTPHTTGSRWAQLSFTVDKTPPAISITSPSDGALVTPNTWVAIHTSASDTYGIDRVEFRIDGELKFTDSTSPYAYGWYVPNTDGIWDITAEAFDRAGNTQVSKIRVSDGLPHEIPIVDGSEPAWSPDGSKIAFVRAGTIFTVNANATNMRTVCAGHAPAWSPDGTLIAYHTGFCWGSSDIYTVELDGSNATRLTHYQGGDCEPVWSPDGSQIAYASANSRNYLSVYKMNADGSGRAYYAGKSWEDDSYPSWLPDSSTVAFSGYRYPYREEIISGGVLLTGNSALDERPSWSPDGSKVAFQSNRDGNWQIYVADADGSNQRRLTNNAANDYSPAWSPDGSKIAFSRNGGTIYLMNYH